VNVLVIDTSVWISYFKGSPFPQVDLALREGRVYLPPIVPAELLSARLKAGQRESLIGFLKELPLIETHFEHWSRVGEMRSKLLAKEFQISTPDAHIAQCALDLDGYLLSEDQIFQKIAVLIG
jgi:tRNA(fMet)-specific endonuclease VapC